MKRKGRASEERCTRTTTGRLRLFSNDEVVNSVSRQHGIDVDEERRMRCTACTFIASAGKELQFKQLAIATASVYLHNFFMKFSLSKYNRYDIAGVCLFLAGKVEEQRRKVKHVAIACHHVRHKSRLPPDSPELKSLCTKMLDLEMLVLQVIEFNFHPSHPYHYCMTTLKKMFAGAEAAGKQLSKEDQKEIAQYAWYLINDSLKSTLCLIHRPELIALACIDAAVKLMNQARKTLDLPQNWYTKYCSTMIEETRREIVHAVMAVIDIDASSQKGDRRSLRARLQLVDDESTSSDPVDATVAPEDITPAPTDTGEKFAPEPKRVKRVD